MAFLVAIIILIGGISMAMFALRSQSLQSLDIAINTKTSIGDFSLSKSLLLIGPEVNFPRCSQQRKELARILQPLLQADYKIIEIYGDLPPAENGRAYEWLDNPLLRKTLNAEEGFHLIHVAENGHTGFHSGQPVVAEALLHIFDLWAYLDDDTEEELVDTLTETPQEEALSSFAQTATSEPAAPVATAQPASAPTDDPIGSSADEAYDPAIPTARKNLPPRAIKPPFNPAYTDTYTGKSGAHSFWHTQNRATPLQEQPVPQHSTTQTALTVTSASRLQLDDYKKAPDRVSAAIKRRSNG